MINILRKICDSWTYLEVADGKKVYIVTINGFEKAQETKTAKSVYNEGGYECIDVVYILTL